MQQTNYQLFDFLDFSTTLDEGDRLWRACTPTEVEEKNGDVFITIPFQKQQNSNEINPDTSEPRKTYVLRLRAYGQKIVRAAIGFDTEWMEDSPMLELDARLTPNPLHVEKTALEWIVKDSHNQTKAIVSFRQPEISWWSDLVPAPAETIDLTLFPDGVH
ncbi:MAG: alpha-xylosidase, partial [Bacteroidota bacterium]|nr:alpha-xylosidase [Bacteroidota bacterium]